MQQLFVLCLTLLSVSVFADVNSLLEDIVRDPSTATARYDYYQHLIADVYPHDPNGLQVLGLLEYCKGNMRLAYRYYFQCADRGDFNKYFKSCVLNSPLLLLKRIAAEEANFKEAFSDFDYLLRRAPHVYSSWTSFGSLFTEWVLSTELDLPVEDRAAVDTMIAALIPLGLGLFPESPVLLAVQGIIHAAAGRVGCASDCFKRARDGQIDGSLAVAVEYFEQLRTDIDTSVVDEFCVNPLGIPIDYQVIVGDGSDITGPLKETYLVAMIELVKLIDFNYQTIDNWNKFAVIHMRILEGMFDVWAAPTDSASVFIGPLFQDLLFLGISLFPRHPGLLFLQGVHSYYYGNINCAVRAFTMAKDFSAMLCLSECSEYAKVSRLLPPLLASARRAAQLSPDGRAEDLQCYPYQQYEVYAEESAVRVDPVGSISTSVDSEEISNLRIGPESFKEVTDKHSLLRALSNCEEHRYEANLSSALHFLDDINVLTSPADFGRRKRVPSKCRLVQIGCMDHLCVGPGWVVADAVPSATAHVISDAKNMSAFANSSINVLYASHIFEHIPRSEAVSVLSRWRNLLTPGGLLLLAIPDIIAISELLLDENVSYKKKLMLTTILYGGHEDEYNIHHAGYFFELIQNVLVQSNFCDVRRIDVFGLFDDCSNYGAVDYNRSLSLNVAAIAC